MGNRVAPERQRLTKRPLPTTLADWEKEVLGVRDFLIRTTQMDSADMYGWPDKIGIYYTFRMIDLFNHKPKRPVGRPRRVGVHR